VVLGRSIAVVLFTDLVGSTELRSRLGEDRAEVLRRQHDGLVTRVIGANHGRLVKNLGDGFMATFTAAAAALAAAVEIQRALDRQNRLTDAIAPLGIRVGLSAGDVTFEGADCFGTPVIEASRLCASADGGQVLASEVVRWLAGSGGGHRFTPVGMLDLKGLPDPVAAIEVAWEPVVLSRVPVPALLTDAGGIFVARHHEMSHLQQLWKEAARGACRVAVFAGEPGVGKTRLAAELAEHVHADGAAVLAGRCDEGLGVPYQPFVEALGQYLAHAGDLRLGRHGGELARLAPEVALLLPDLPKPMRSDPETERYRLFDAVAGWLGAAFPAHPLLLVLDDLQWAAEPTLLLLRHIVRSPALDRILILGTYRDTDLGADHPLVQVLADLRRHAGVDRMSLEGLDRSGVATYMEHAAGHALGDEDLLLAQAIHAETEGNPFFVQQVLRHLTETGAIERHEGRWTARLPLDELGIPDGVREVVARRLSRLSEEANQTLRLAAVVGTQFEVPVIQTASGLDPEAVLDALEETTAARLISEVSDTHYRFAHALVRETLYGGLSATRRTALHQHVAKAIEIVHDANLDEHLPALAHHWASASVAGSSRAIAYATQAGDRALVQLAHHEATAYYRQGLDLLDAANTAGGDARRLELLISLGEAQRRAGDPVFRDTLLVAARVAQEEGDGNALARAALANTRGILPSATTHVDRDRVAALEAAVSVAVGDDTPTRARLLATLALELTASPNHQRRVALSDEALAVARRLGHDAALAEVLTARFYTLASPDTLAARLSDVTELVAIAGRLGDPMLLANAHFLRARAHTEHGDLHEARTDLEMAENIASDLSQPTLQWYATCARAAHLLLAGDIGGAEALALEAGRLADTTSQPDAPTWLAAQLFGVRAEQDRLEEIETQWAEAVQRFPDAVFPRAMLALLLSELDRHSEANALVEGIGAFALVPYNNVWLWTMAVLAVVVGRLHDAKRCVALHEALLPYADQIAGIAPLWIGSVSHYLAVLAIGLGQLDEAEARFAAAEATHIRVDAPVWLARTRLEWARMLLTRQSVGDAERASVLLGQVLEVARGLSLGNLERLAIELEGRQ
jgi:class 3 adenylate cyclase